ncbi:MAG: hypothetical protein JRJ60_21285 [Deltaproteobacteria bacterium]|nr:hypothetical protein [Deltaproteobacteria bacterium]
MFFAVMISYGPVAFPAGAEADGPPAIHVELAVHQFAPVYEGEPLSHAFRVENRGGKDLHLKEVTST